MPKRSTVVVVSQVFVPDPAAVGQYVAEVALELAGRGRSNEKYGVRVYASAWGYENPSARYPRREILNGADVRRLPLASFGKKSMPLRVLGTAAFMVQAFFAVLFTPGIAGILFSTSPPLIGLPLSVAARIRRVPIVFWAMDLNPDQLIALGKLQPTDWTCRLLELANRFILRRTTTVIALDRFMADRLAAGNTPRSKILVIPPWPLEKLVQTDPAGQEENPFRARHNLAGKFIVMYSGNHSPSNPLTTLLDAAVQLKENPEIRFLFVGGGSGKSQVEIYIRNHNLSNALSLPYQPLAELKHSLSAADVHVVSLGQNMVGIVHPCKIYGAMAVGRPVLFLGPKPSHIGDLLDRQDIGLHVSHGDVAGVIAAIARFRAMSSEELRAMGRRAQSMLKESLSETLLRGKFCDAVESAMRIG